jgi:hypothetical protein
MNLDVWLDGRLEHGTTVAVRVGDRPEVPARVSWLGGGFHQLRLDATLEGVEAQDEVVAGGAPGRVLDPDAPRHGPSNDLLVRLTQLRDGA